MRRFAKYQIINSTLGNVNIAVAAVARIVQVATDGVKALEAVKGEARTILLPCSFITADVAEYASALSAGRAVKPCYEYFTAASFCREHLHHNS